MTPAKFIGRPELTSHDAILIINERGLGDEFKRARDAFFARVPQRGTTTLTAKQFYDHTMRRIKTSNVKESSAMRWIVDSGLYGEYVSMEKAQASFLRKLDRVG